jgi:type II secretory pathway pseudopilin PulG
MATSTAGAPRVRRSRAGRAFVELLVALLLLSVAGGGAVRLVRSGHEAAEQVAFAQQARALLRDAAERVQADPCVPRDGTQQLGRQHAEWSAVAAGGLSAGTFRSWLVPSGVRGAAARTLEADFAGWCP